MGSYHDCDFNSVISLNRSFQQITKTVDLLKMQKIKEFFNKIFIFEADSDFFIMIRYCDKIFSSSLFSAGKMKLFDRLLFTILAFQFFVAFYDFLMIFINSYDIILTIDDYVDKVYMIVGILFVILRMVLLKISSNHKSFLKAVNLLNTKRFKKEDESAFKLRKKSYELNNKKNLLLLIILFGLLLGWMWNLENFTIFGWIDFMVRISFFAWGLFYFKGLTIVLTLLRIFTMEFKILNMAIRNTFEEAKNRPSFLQSPNMAIRMILQDKSSVTAY